MTNLSEKPYAVFIGRQEDVDGRPPLALYNIIGGPSHGATVPLRILKEKGIKILRTKRYRFTKRAFMQWDLVEIA